jgi:hypothetical protein
MGGGGLGERGERGTERERERKRAGERERGRARDLGWSFGGMIPAAQTENGEGANSWQQRFL